MEEFVVRVFKNGKVTVPKRLRELLSIDDGDYVRLAVVEILRKSNHSRSQADLEKRRVPP